MRIAICISGSPRMFDYEASVRSMKILIERFNADVFMHTFHPHDETPYLATPSWQYARETYDQIEFLDMLRDFYGPTLRKAVAEIYREHIKTLPDWTQYPNHTGHPNGVLSIFSMYNKIAACHRLLREYEAEAGVQYDVEIKMRTDIAFYEFPNSLDFVRDGVVYTPDHDPRGNHNSGYWCGGIMDSVFVGTPTTMDKLSGIVDKWDEFRAKSVAFKHERVLRQQAEDNNLTWTTFPVSSRWANQKLVDGKWHDTRT